MIKILKKVISLITRLLYHGELSASFVESSKSYTQVSPEKASKVRETCGKLFIPFVVFVLFSFIFALYIFVNLGVSSFFKNSTKSNLQVHFLNVGQGDSIFIKSPNGNSMLIDSGPQNEKVIGEIQKFKNIFDRKINVLLATHADADHIGSMKKVIEKFKYQIFAYSGLSSDTKLFQDLMNTVNGKVGGQNSGKNKKDQTLILTAGMSIVLDEQKDVRFDVLFPDFDFQIEGYQNCKRSAAEKIQKLKSDAEKNKTTKSKAEKTKTKPATNSKKDSCLKFLNTETNLNSVVGKLSYGSTSFMLTGDSPVEIEKFIINKYRNDKNIKKNTQADSSYKNHPQPIDLYVDVLKLGHHGSKTSTSPEYLEALLPEFAIVSVGKDNRYKHPNKSVLDTIDTFRKTHPDFQKILRTDTDGTISFYSDGYVLTEQSSE